MYEDQIEKINYYKEKITHELLKTGKFPGKEEINKKVADIDSRLSIFQYTEIENGEEFDTEYFNKIFVDILADLQILYKLAYKLSVEKYKELKEYADMHLTELSSFADRYERKSKFEVGSTYIGTTKYYQTGGRGFDFELGANHATVKLGSISFKSGSKVACIFESQKINPKDVVFSFGNMNCSPFSINKDYFNVPGEPKCKLYSYETPADMKVNEHHAIKPEGFTPDTNAKYFIYAGQNIFKTSTGLYEKIVGTPFRTTHPTKIEFYIKDATFIRFDMNQQPISKNFNGSEVEHPERNQKIFMEVGTGFTFDMVTDGQIYAERKEGQIKNNILYYPGFENLFDYLVEEYKFTDDKTYDVSVTINKLSREVPLEIDMIALKESLKI